MNKYHKKVTRDCQKRLYIYRSDCENCPNFKCRCQNCYNKDTKDKRMYCKEIGKFCADIEKCQCRIPSFNAKTLAEEFKVLDEMVYGLQIQSNAEVPF